MVTKVIVDCDPGVDDAMALLLLFGEMRRRQNTIEILGITITHGNLGKSEGVLQLAKNASRVLHLIEECSTTEEEKKQTRIPVVMGSNALLCGDQHDGAPFVHGDDGLGGKDSWIELNEENKKELEKDIFSRIKSDITASDWIIETASKSTEKISLITLGPLTNIALCLRKDKEFANKIDKVFTMGGVLNSVGNISEVSEANVFNDPLAANEFFSSDLEIYLAPLNLTKQLSFNRELLIYDLIDANPLVGSFILQISKIYLEFANTSNADRRNYAPIHDSTAVALLLFSDIFSEWEKLWIRVEVESKLTRGMTVCDRRCTTQNFREWKCNVHVPGKVNPELFIKNYISAIKALSPNENKLELSKTINPRGILSRRLFFICLGGSFNPIHTQHISIMNAAKIQLEKQFGNGCVLAGFFAVCKDDQIQKNLSDNQVIKFHHRMNMINEAVKDVFWISSVKESYFPKADQLLTNFGKQHGIEFARVIGADCAQIDKAVEKHDCFYSIIIGRQGHTDNIRLQLEGVNDEKILFDENELQNVSSTVIREKLTAIHKMSDKTEKQNALNELVNNDFLDKNVANYILENEQDLYVSN